MGPSGSFWFIANQSEAWVDLQSASIVGQSLGAEPLTHGIQRYLQAVSIPSSICRAVFTKCWIIAWWLENILVTTILVSNYPYWCLYVTWWVSLPVSHQPEHAGDLGYVSWSGTGIITVRCFVLFFFFFLSKMTCLSTNPPPLSCLYSVFFLFFLSFISFSHPLFPSFIILFPSWWHSTLLSKCVRMKGRRSKMIYSFK